MMLRYRADTRQDAILSSLSKPTAAASGIMRHSHREYGARLATGVAASQSTEVVF